MRVPRRLFRVEVPGRLVSLFSTLDRARPRTRASGAVGSPDRDVTVRRSFDPAFFPDPEGMAAQVKELTGAEMMVSLWPSVENLSENYVALQTNGWLVATRDGPGVTDSFAGVYTRLVDSTNPGAREFLCECFRGR